METKGNLKSAKVSVSVEYQLPAFGKKNNKRKVTEEELTYLFSNESYADIHEFVEDAVLSVKGLWKLYQKRLKASTYEASIHVYLEELQPNLSSIGNVFRYSLYGSWNLHDRLYLKPLYSTDQAYYYKCKDISSPEFLRERLTTEEFLVDTVKNLCKEWVKENLSLAAKVKEE